MGVRLSKESALATEWSRRKGNDFDDDSDDEDCSFSCLPLFCPPSKSQKRSRYGNGLGTPLPNTPNIGKGKRQFYGGIGLEVEENSRTFNGNGHTVSPMYGNYRSWEKQPSAVIHEGAVSFDTIAS